MSAEQELLNQIIEKAWKDPAFKEKLLADPKAAILESFNIDVPDDIQVSVVEETPKSFYLVIPPAPVEGEEDDAASMW
ncbi:NHLP leader peptide family RiPP precursor [Paenibacillus sepulcri]|uniref:NHLP leader peptide family RiPP n=1 Tax=Paenibacillus sepulcri TaxID=359917 RepID=A0ABS7BYL9_9BACL|nr:NHLP leader peptide family RiPP precursor [Paenibacillus sepulcri]